MGIKSYTAAPTAAGLALGLFFTPPVSIAIDAIINTVASLVSAAIGNLGFMSPAMGQPGALTKKQSDVLKTRTSVKCCHVFDIVNWIAIDQHQVSQRCFRPKVRARHES
jgi:hypothetical protein